MPRMPDRTDAAAPLEALTGSLREYRDPHGADLFARVEDFYRWQDVRRQHGYWPYSKSIEDAPKPFCAARDDAGAQLSRREFRLAGLSQPRLASRRSRTPRSQAIAEYGVHSAGSSAFLGNTRFSLALQRSIADFLEVEHTVLYPTGWAAGYGVIKGLVRPDDHIVMDGLAHACLQDGAAAATRNVHLHGHLNIQSVRRHLARIRARDTAERDPGRHRGPVLDGFATRPTSPRCRICAANSGRG